MLINFLIKVIYFYLISFFLAILEIQIEGPCGWAEKLPTWRAKPGSKIDRIFKKIVSQKELTGYHTALMIFLLLFFHLPFVWFWRWNIFDELEILSIYVLFATVWDFLWFVLNPQFSLHDFGPAKVWWHKKWLGKMPIDYYFAILGCVILLIPETIIINPTAGIYKMIILLGANLVLIILTVIIYPKAY